MVIQQKLLEFTDNLVMGILNVTPDSFYTNSRLLSEKEILARAERMLLDGADILDVGGYSSRPGSTPISVEEENRRILPAIKALKRSFPDTLISLDTFRSTVAEVGLDHGADLINDISAGSLDPELPKIVAKYKVPYIIMHMRGNPQTMQAHTDYKNIIQEMLSYFDQKINAFRAMGINDLILDPGFGFSKKSEDNFEIMRHLERFHMFELPLLVGVSRKSFIQKALQVNAEDALNGTTVVHSLLLQKGARILRTHDVLQAKQAIVLEKNIR